MIIRKAKKDDLDNNLFDLYKEGFKLHYEKRKDIFTNRTDTELKDNLLEIIENDNGIIVIEEDNYIIAYAIYHTNQKEKKIMWIDQICVDSLKRNKGYGKMIMKYLEDIARKEDYDRIELNCWTFNENAIKLYEHLGFVEQRKIFELNLNNKVGDGTND